MKRERFQQVDEVFQAALDCDPTERAAFLDHACKGDLALRSEVESLIKSHEQAHSFMLSPMLEQSMEILTNDIVQSVVGRLIGSYKIIREIGHGGMGTVYLGMRADDQYKKRVAIKLVRRGMDTDNILSRFRHERQILASLDHPNIARLLEGGTTEDGLSYFVMEYIEGQTIDEYCDAQKLSTHERLNLFRTVCSAVHYAHQSLIVHRDIKPSNILVTAGGIPKLLDFGIAKLLRPEMYAQTIAPTETMVRPMTPDYASPEQVRGQPITTASDVYSLGVLLYELLTGHRPYRLKNSLPHEIEQIICEQEPERPSTAVNRTEEVPSSTGAGKITLTPELVSKTREGQPDKLRRRLAGDLDNIVLMAMRKEPRRRFGSAEQFSEDIRRHLEGLPVKARKDTFSYRASKFTRRHKAAVAIVAAFLILVFSFVAVTISQSIRANRERVKAERVAAFLVELFQVSDPSQSKGSEIKAREILDKGAERIEKELGDQPEVEAKLLETVGTVYRTLDLYKEARPLLEKSLAIRRGLFGEENLEVAQSERELGFVYERQGEIAKAIELFRQSLATRRKLLPSQHKDIAQTISDLATTLGQLRQAKEDEEALRLFHEALNMRRKLFGNEHEDVAQSLNNFALFLQERGDYSAAEPMLREAIAIDRKIYDGDDPAFATNLNNLALVLSNKGDQAGAEQFYRESLQMNRRLFGADSFGLVLSLNNLAEVLREEEKFDEAEPLYREALAIAQKRVGKEHPYFAILTNNLARLLHDKGDLAAAESLYREAQTMYRKAFGDEHPRTAKNLDNLAALQYDKGDRTAAEAMYRNALEIQRQKLPKDHKDIALSLVGLGKVIVSKGKAQEAESLLREGLEIRRSKLLKEHPAIGDAAIALGNCLTALGKYDEAEALLLEGYEISKAKRGDQDKQTRLALARLINLYKVWGKPYKLALYRDK